MHEQLIQAIITEMNLPVQAESIDHAAPLFGDDGLGLDSLDAVELIVIVKKHFGVQISSMDEARVAFASVNALVEYLESHN